MLLELRDLGRLLVEREAARGGISLDLPEQLVTEAGGRYELVYRAPLAAEAWNAQVSLLAGMCAARLMLDAGTGILRTLPAPPGDVVADLRRRAAALDVAWPAGGDGEPEPLGVSRSRFRRAPWMLFMQSWPRYFSGHCPPR